MVVWYGTSTIPYQSKMRRMIVETCGCGKIHFLYGRRPDWGVCILSFDWLSQKIGKLGVDIACSATV